MFKNTILLMLTVFLVSCVSGSNIKKGQNLGGAKEPKNIIFMIVDGMGFEHVKAARIYRGMKPFRFENFTCRSKVSTCSFAGADENGQCLADSDEVTDSAAAATAMATGQKVNNGVISRAIPDGKEDMETILERMKRQHKSTGIIATKLFTDATPAAFVSHADDRDMTEEILRDMFQGSRPNVVFGADTPLHRQYAKESKSPYQMVHKIQDLRALASLVEQGKPCFGDDCPFVYGGFGQYDMIPDVYKNKAGLPLEITPASKFVSLNLPHLSQMTDAALKILSKNENGFFLMVESSMPDMISHYNTQIDATTKAPKAIEVLIHEMLEVENTVKVIEAYVAHHPDTLLVLTADHETGGLVIEADKTECLGKENCVPSIRWTSKKYEETNESPSRHTNVDVPLYALGNGADRFCKEKINNIEIANLALAK
jgi:alkaline phosphatase